MKKVVPFLSLILLFLGCDTHKEINLRALNGYWEIEKAVAPNGEEKPYQFSTFVDFFSVAADSSGYRAKLKPNFKGTYEGNKVKQQFKIAQKNTIYYIKYTVGDASWSEILVEATPKKIITKNEEGVLYHYKPFSPISVE